MRLDEISGEALPDDDEFGTKCGVCDREIDDGYLVCGLCGQDVHNRVMRYVHYDVHAKTINNAIQRDMRDHDVAGYEECQEALDFALYGRRWEEYDADRLHVIRTIIASKYGGCRMVTRLDEMIAERQ
jgi:hypothetical protein